MKRKISNFKKKKNDKEVPFCPHCNSQDVKTDFSNAAKIGCGLLNNSKKCNHCGYAGVFPIAAIKDIPAVKRSKKNDKNIPMNLLIEPKPLTKTDAIIISFFKWGFLVLAISWILFFSYLLFK